MKKLLMWLLMATVLVTLPNCGDDGDKVAPNTPNETPQKPNDEKKDEDNNDDESGNITDGDPLTGKACANNEILYTTQYGYPIDLSQISGFNGYLMSNTYANGIGRLTFNADVTTIPNNAFKGQTSIKQIILPSILSKISSAAFSGCTSLTSINIPNSVTSIGNHAFEGCTGLTSITIPNSTTIIDNYAFSDCTCLTSITIPNGVTIIGSYAFSGCTGLTSINIPDGVSLSDHCFENTNPSEYIVGKDCSFTTKTFENCTGKLIINSTIPAAKIDPVYLKADPRRYISYFATSKLSSIIIGDDVTTIGDNAFANLNLKTLQLGKKVDIPNASIFWNLSVNNLIINCYIPDGEETGKYSYGGIFRMLKFAWDVKINSKNIGTYAFQRANILSVHLSDNVERVKAYAFFDTDLSIHIDGNPFIENYAFYYQTSGNGVVVRCKSTIPPTISTDTFCKVYKVYVPRNAYNTYLAAESWAPYKWAITPYDFE